MNSKILQKTLDYLGPWLGFRYRESEMPGFVVAISHKGKVLFNKAYGYANVERQQLLQPDNLFRITSHSKTFTATAVLQLAEQDKLRIDDYAVRYLPWLGKHEDKHWQKVTIRQLLSHSAGVIRDGLEADYWQLENNFPNSEELKKLVLETDLVLEANTQMKYSNVGYGLLGLIIEAISGQPYNEFVVEKIIKPLGLKNTGPELTGKVGSKLATGYSRRDVNKTRKPFGEISTGALSPATGFYSNAADLCAFYRALRVGSGKLLNDEQKREMQRTQWRVHNTRENEEYGLGLGIEYFDNHRLFGHGGGFPGQQTHSLYSQEDDLVVVVLTNCLNSDLDSLMYGALSIVNYYQANSQPSRPKTKLERFNGRFMDLWGVTDIIAVGNKVLAVYPGWRPFGSPDELDYVDKATLKVAQTTGYHSAGEQVHFNFDDSGRIKSVNYCGSTMLPEKDYLAKQASIKVIEAKNNKS